MQAFDGAHAQSCDLRDLTTSDTSFDACPADHIPVGTDGGKSTSLTSRRATLRSRRSRNLTLSWDGKDRTLKRRFTFILVALVLQMLLPMVVAAADTGTCSEGSAVNRFRGHGHVLGSNVMAGAEAKIENQALNICTSGSDNDRSNHVWVAVDDNGGNSNDLVQAGMLHCIDPSNVNCNNYGTHEFWTWGRSHLASGCSGFSDVAPVNKYLGAFPATSATFSVVKTATQWQIWVNGGVQQTVSLASICWSPHRAVYVGESWDIADAIGGPVDNPVRLSSAIYEQSVGGAWSNVNWGTGAGPCNISSDARYKCTAPTTTSLDLWTVQP